MLTLAMPQPQPDPSADLLRPPAGPERAAGQAGEGAPLSIEERDHRLRERDVALREREALFREQQGRWASWSNPLTVALVAAAIGTAGNAGVAYWNGQAAREQERDKAEYARVLEMIKVGNPDQAADNLGMLLEMGLYRDVGGDLKRYLAARKPGQGGYLPAAAGTVAASTAPPASAEALQILEKGVAQAPWLKIALAERGVREISGEPANERILEYIASVPSGVGNPMGDEFPWNSQFVNWVMRSAGLDGTDSAVASSWSSWGEPIADGRPGAIVVFKRDGGGGVVGFYVRDLPGGYVEVLGGNIFNEVAISKISKTKLTAIRWPSSKPIP